MSDGTGLKDPCEHDSIDVCDILSLQDREEISKSAQYYLRYELLSSLLPKLPKLSIFTYTFMIQNDNT